MTAPTIAMAKARLGITDANDDAILTTFLEDVTDWIQDFTGRTFAAEDGATYLVDTGPGAEIEIRRGIRAVDLLEIADSDQPETGGTYGTTIPAAQIVLRPAAIERRPGWPATRILILQSGVGPLRRAINGARITGDFGFVDWPNRARGVAIDAVVAAYSDRKMGTGGVLGADDTAAIPWANYFRRGTPQWQTLMRFRSGSGIS